MRLVVSVSDEELREAVIEGSHEDAMGTILAIDLAIGDAGFTEDLIKRLAGSLRGDLDAADWASLTAEIANLGAKT